MWNHARAVVAQYASERSGTGVEAVGAYSQYVLSGAATAPQVTTVYMDARPKPKSALSGAAARDTQWAKNYANQVVPPKPAKAPGAEEEEAEEVADEEDKGELPDVVYEQNIFRSFGEGLSETESYQIAVALKRLLDKEPLAKARFWGKISGTKRDYYIAETKVDESRVPEKEEAEAEETEVVGKPAETIMQGLQTHKAKEPPTILAEDAKGVNESKYYVATSDDLTEWVALPDVLPAHITAARKIRKIFSGELDAAVEAHPPFPGVERHYLRAQIARISHATTVCPKDIYSTDTVEEEEDEEDGEKKPKRFEVPAPEEVPALNTTDAPDAGDAEAIAPVKGWFYGFKNDELLEPKNWVHIAPQLLTEGRATVYKPEEADADPDEPEDEPPVPPVEYVNPFLSDLGHDAGICFSAHSKQGLPAWSVRKAYANESARSKRYLVRSVVWPGAICAAETEDEKPGAYFQNMYIGTGLKNPMGHPYCPPLPPLPSIEYPCGMLQLQKDATRDDELEFEPAPPPPKLPGGEDEEAAEDE